MARLRALAAALDRLQKERQVGPSPTREAPTPAASPPPLATALPYPGEITRYRSRYIYIYIYGLFIDYYATIFHIFILIYHIGVRSMLASE
jgi:hypothetical protein